MAFAQQARLSENGHLRALDTADDVVWQADTFATERAPEEVSTKPGAAASSQRICLIYVKERFVAFS